MKNFILLAALLIISMNCWADDSVSETKCKQFEFDYKVVSGENHYSHHVRTENYEFPLTFDVNNENPSMKTPVGQEILGFSVVISDTNGQRKAYCLYGLTGSMMEDKNNTISCPPLKPEVDNTDKNNPVCKFYLPSSF